MTKIYNTGKTCSRAGQRFEEKNVNFVIILLGLGVKKK
jgi:hypothetical protein